MKKFSTLVFIFFYFSSFSQQPEFWRNYGFSQWVRGIAFDGDTAWCATYGGLVRIIQSTGERKTYNASNSNLRSNNLNRVIIDQHHNKWITSEAGLSKFDNQNFINYHQSVPQGPTINYLAHDINGNIWYLGINPIDLSTGLINYDGNTFSTIDSLNPSMPANIFYSISKDKNGNIYLITDSNIIKYDGSAWQNIVSGPFLNLSKNLCVDALDRIWYSSNYYLYMFDGTWHSYSSINTPVLNSTFYQIVPDDSGNVYINSGQSIIKTNGITWSSIDTSAIQSSGNAFASIAIDVNNRIWIGTWYDGIFEFDSLLQNISHVQTSEQNYLFNGMGNLALGKYGEVWMDNLAGIVSKEDTIWTRHNSFPSAYYSIGALAVDTNNVLWASFDYQNGGPVSMYYDGTQWMNSSFNTLSGSRDVTVDMNNNKWFATTEGLIKFDGTNYMVYDVTNSQLSDNFILIVYADSHNKIWIHCPYGTFQRFDGINWQSFNIQIPNILSVTEDLSGNIYVIGTDNASNNLLGKYDGISWTYFQNLPGIPSGKIKFDHYNNLWAGFHSVGLGKFDGSNWTVYSVNNSGLPENRVTDIAIDKYNNIWLTAPYTGLTIFNENGIDFTTPAADRINVGGRVFYDIDTNGIRNSTEPYISQQFLLESTTNTTTSTNINGEYKFHLLPGNYQVTPEIINWYVTTDSMQYHPSVVASDISNLDFGISADPFREYSLDFISSRIRCGFLTPFWINYFSTGTIVDSGYVELILDSLTTFQNSVPPPDYQNGTTLRWNFSNLVPFASTSIQLNIQISNSPGNVIHAVSSLYYFDNGIPVFYSSKQIDNLIMCANDPNDKDVSPHGEAPFHFTFIGDTLNYTIRFQNVGNDTAFFVKVIDTLDNYLDPNSIKFISSSHPCTMIIDKHVAIFNFATANLPDSTTDYTGSNGYLRFSIATKNTTPLHHVIRNTAGIYFNYNNPVITNTVFNTMIDSTVTGINNINRKNEIEIYPNPFNSFTTIRYSNPERSNYKVIVTDLCGRQVLVFNDNTGSFNIRSLPKACYIVTVSSLQNSYRGMLVAE